MNTKSKRMASTGRHAMAKTVQWRGKTRNTETKRDCWRSNAEGYISVTVVKSNGCGGKDTHDDDGDNVVGTDDKNYFDNDIYNAR